MIVNQRLSHKAELIIFGSVFIILSIVYGIYAYDLGWHPDDECRYAEYGRRILQGSLPHVDFEDQTAGGISFLNALIFKVAGTSLLHPRIFLLATFSLCLLPIASVLARHVGILCAFGVCAASMFWGPAMYLSPTPQWYCATIGLVWLYCTFRYSDSGDPVWVASTGLMSGLLLLFSPPIGLLSMLGFAVILIALGSDSPDFEASDETGGRPPAIYLQSLLVLFSILVVLTVTGRTAPLLGAYFSMGMVCLLLASLYAEWNTLASKKSYLRRAQTFFVYVSTAIATAAPFILIYLIRGGRDAFGHFVRACFELPSEVSSSLWAPESFAEFLLLLPPNLFLVLTYAWVRQKLSPLLYKLGCFFLLLFLCLFFLPDPEHNYYRWMWLVHRWMLLETILLSIFCLFFQSPVRIRSAVHRRLVLVAVVAACIFTFLQFPNETGASYLYVMSFQIILTVTLAAPYIAPREAKTETNFTPLKSMVYAWLLFLFTFSATYLKDAETVHYGKGWIPRAYYTQLEFDRAKIYVTEEQTNIYNNIGHVIDVNTDELQPIIAFPDCHWAYFLTNRKNPFFGYGVPRLTSQTSLSELLDAALDREGADVKVVICNLADDPQGNFSPEGDIIKTIESSLIVNMKFGSFQTFSSQLEWEFHRTLDKGTLHAPPRKLKEGLWGQREIDDWKKFVERAMQLEKPKSDKPEKSKPSTVPQNEGLPSPDNEASGND